jgi:hypothetical protein
MFSRGHYIDDHLGGEKFVPTPRNEDREYERVVQEQLDALPTPRKCADCGVAGGVLYSTELGPWRCWECAYGRS